ncbi:MAG: motility protein A [Candidatus Nitronauta litoralis]|uniref:Motility protein A n=1 Tax=Candidatus Nitronauta litoralis TaxID=2705533 RepID=A0A7T0G140_9BACT|nr:MAG: motility protein A [Candidatus Nitronauta litoralis]
MDSASFSGILLGIALIIGAIFIGGEIHNFWNLPGIMIVIGGTIAATFVTFQLKDVLRAFKAAAFVFREKKRDPNDMVETMVELCTMTRRQGLIAIGKIEFQDGNAFLRKACNLIADGSKEDNIRDTLNIEIESLKQRHLIIQDIFRKMATYSPAFGMIGTLIGLVQMLSRLSNPETIGPAMAVALLTTFYGVLLANLIFLPIAGKLKDRTLNEVIMLETIFEGAISILNDNNPLSLYDKLSAFIPESERRPLSRTGTGKNFK